mmetsp:Transcript_23106/g.66204  ORF Transcript_23106/g.66204 Transcript_23106/m.66204 type:complete len:380 (-) Transcript_23106:462-1601(-)
MLPSWTTDPETPLPEAAAATPEALRGWRLRAPQENDAALRASFSTVLRASAALPPDRRLVMYDADDGGARSAPLEGPALPPASSPFRKRLDARRNAKPKKPDEQRRVCTPFDPDAFHFGKIRNPAERLLRLQLTGGRYDLLTNKFPLFPKHMLLVSASLVPQQMTMPHLRSVGELIRPSSFCAYFNSWCASASVNHFHCHVIDELPPVAKLALVPGAVLAGGVETLRPDGFPGHCYVYGWSQVGEVGAAVWAMQKANQPHNLLFSPKHVYVWPKPLQRPARCLGLRRRRGYSNRVSSEVRCCQVVGPLPRDSGRAGAARLLHCLPPARLRQAHRGARGRALRHQHRPPPRHPRAAAPAHPLRRSRRRRPRCGRLGRAHL